MTGLSLTLLILASLTAVNADSCNKPDSSHDSYCIVENQLHSLPEGNELQSRFEMFRNYFRTSEFPLVGYLDPLSIENHRLDDATLSAPVDITATTIRGLLGFQVTDIKVSLNSEKFQVDLLFPELCASGRYSMLPAPDAPADAVYGTGEFVLTAFNLRVQINGETGKTSDGKLYIERMESQLSLEAADSDITGLSDDAVARDVANWYREYLPGRIPHHKPMVDAYLKAYMQYFNSHVKSHAV